MIHPPPPLVPQLIGIYDLGYNYLVGVCALIIKTLFQFTCYNGSTPGAYKILWHNASKTKFGCIYVFISQVVFLILKSKDD